MRMYITLAFIALIPVGCSTGPSPSNCYGRGQPGCEIYGSPKTVLVESRIDDDYIERFKIPDKQKYLNRQEVLAANKWFKSEGAELQTRRTLLECGSGDYIGENSFDRMRALSPQKYNNGLVLIKKCMLNAGFKYIGNFDACVTDDLEACQSDAIIPRPSVERRLDSHYCTGYGKKTPECQSLGQEHQSSHGIRHGKERNKSSYTSLREYPERSLQLQQEMQRDSNRQMDKLLHNTSPKISR